MLLPTLNVVAALLVTSTRPSVAPDTTRYPIINNRREAGEKTVIRDGNSVAVRYN
jgi:hypothetical protein